MADMMAAAVRCAVAGVLLSVLLGACGGSRESARPGGATVPSPEGPATVRSNTARGDYVGSAACAPCHAEVTSAWAGSPMHRMTRTARGADVQAPFDGTDWRFKDDGVHLERRGDDRFVRVEPA